MTDVMGRSLASLSLVLAAAGVVASLAAAGPPDGPVARCVQALVADARHQVDDPAATATPSVLPVIAPHLCADAHAHDALDDDGSMTNAEMRESLDRVIARRGEAWFQRVVNTDLAVHRYGLARSAGAVTVLHRCVAMAFAGWDAISPAPSPARSGYRRVARAACVDGVARGLVPASGSPSVTTWKQLYTRAAARAS